MAAAIGPTATVSIVRDAGHACHLEHPDAVAATIARFCTVSQAIEPGTRKVVSPKNVKPKARKAQRSLQPAIRAPSRPPVTGPARAGPAR